MNAKQAEEVIHLAKEKNLFFMEGMWTRFFPSTTKVRQLIHDGTLGDIKLVICDFGFKGDGTARLSQPELGGGALLDVGVYPISFSSMIFGGTPTKVYATAALGATGVDEQQAVVLHYKPDQIANLSFTFLADTPKECVVIGDKGRVKLHAPFWCSTKITVSLAGKPDEVIDFPLPHFESNHTFNFTNSIGMTYEAAHVQQLLKEGKLESNIIPQAESLVILKTMDEVRRQIGLKYSYE